MITSQCRSIHQRTTTGETRSFERGEVIKNHHNQQHHQRHYTTYHQKPKTITSFQKLTSIAFSASTDIVENNNDHTASFLSKLLRRFQGDFDNYNQVYSDRKNGLKPKEGGGHEHFHVTLIPIDVDILPPSLFSDNSQSTNEYGAVLAAYYFDGMPNRIFRLRLYTFVSNNNNGNDHVQSENNIEMKLFTLNPSLEAQLRQTSEEPLSSWTSILQNYSKSNTEEVDEDNQNETSDMISELKRCDILWTHEPNPIRHSYFNDANNNQVDANIRDPADAFHAIMINDHDVGGVLLESQMAPGLYIRIQDELSLWDNELWVNDRGHNAETGKMVYGNHLGVPYKMTRVTSLESTGKGKFERKMVDPSLSWTLGDQYRTTEEYDMKMDDIGGTSTSYNPKKK